LRLPGSVSWNVTVPRYGSLSKPPSSRLPDEGRIDATPDEVVALDDPAKVEKVNAGWIRLATEYGLFTDDREFLLAVSYAEGINPESDAELAWVRVRLDDKWSIADGTVPALGIPEFTAMSINESTLMRTTLWGNGSISTLVVPEPSAVKTIRRRAEHMASDSRYPPAVQEAARAWLTRGQPSP
jgi:hypothetical protein